MTKLNYERPIFKYIDNIKVAYRTLGDLPHSKDFTDLVLDFNKVILSDLGNPSKSLLEKSNAIKSLAETIHSHSLDAENEHKNAVKLATNFSIFFKDLISKHIKYGSISSSDMYLFILSAANVLSIQKPYMNMKFNEIIQKISIEFKVNILLADVEN